MSSSSPTFTMPRSIRPVTTVPRPVIVNTSSTGIRNGLSSSRCGSGMNVSHASISFWIDGVAVVRRVALERLERRAADDRGVVTRVAVLAQQLAELHLDQVEQLLVALADHVALVQVHHHRRDVHLAPEQHVLARLRHRAVRRRHHQDRAVHLRRARDHVLDVVRVARAIDVRVVPLVALVLHVRRRDRDAARLLFRRLVDLIERRELREALRRLHLRDRSGQRGLAVVDVTDRSDVDVGLVADEFFLRHGCPRLVLFEASPLRELNSRPLPYQGSALPLC